MNEVNKQKCNVQLLTKKEQDINSILKVEYSAFSANLLNDWSLTPYLRYGCVFGLFICGSMRGFVIFIRSWENPRFAYLAELAIDRESQGKGNGYRLLLHSLLHLKKDGLSSVGLTVDPDNSRACHLYEKLGFEVVEYRKDEYGQGRDRLFLKLDLENWAPS